MNQREKNCCLQHILKPLNCTNTGSKGMLLHPNFIQLNPEPCEQTSLPAVQAETPLGKLRSLLLMTRKANQQINLAETCNINEACKIDDAKTRIIICISTKVNNVQYLIFFLNFRFSRTFSFDNGTHVC